MQQLIKKPFTRLMLVFSLVCYLAMSSIAAVHAFPMLGNVENDDSTELMPNCHQEVLNSFVDIGFDSSNSASPCKIFCSAMVNVIPAEFNFTFSPMKPTISVAFFSENLLSHQLEVEPHPPK